MDIYELKLIEEVNKIKIPIMLIHGVKDALIDMQHSIQLFEKCEACLKIINFFDGGHNTRRDKLLIEKIIDFFKTYLNEETFQI